ncbi:hypothetical protein B0T16DRAFT_17762 [Cercophora newfieldiana]|uniref:Uncharacterized protein n=1 Tax=Cercophora newfieldiana TaxID=92897 RepID=A0AA39YQ57_9PEZI|nr:hypothetical protein B0T16DRAFT_17762 [Cercophora newfieldiana]
MPKPLRSSNRIIKNAPSPGVDARPCDDLIAQQAGKPAGERMAACWNQSDAGRERSIGVAVTLSRRIPTGRLQANTPSYPEGCYRQADRLNKEVAALHGRRIREGRRLGQHCSCLRKENPLVHSTPFVVRSPGYRRFDGGVSRPRFRRCQIMWKQSSPPSDVLTSGVGFPRRGQVTTARSAPSLDPFRARNERNIGIRAVIAQIWDRWIQRRRVWVNMALAI